MSVRGRMDRVPAAWRWVIGIVTVVVVVNVVLGAVRSAFGGPGGPTSSSYATGPDGAAALAELLARHGHPVAPQRGALAETELDPAVTLFVLEPSVLPPDDIDALKEHVTVGGTLVIGGGPPAWTEPLFEHPPEWTPQGPISAEAIAMVPETNGVERVRADGRGTWSELGGTLPILGTSEMTIASVGTVGAGRVVALADVSPLQNRFLSRADNAAFGLALAGPAGKPVLFAEGVHGYGTETGIDAVPARWKWTLGGLTVAALVWLVAIGRRLGPPEQEARLLPPARRAYVDALATTLARTNRRDEAIAPVRAEVKAALARRAGIAGDADDRALRGAAKLYGLSDEEVRAIFGQAASESDVIAVGTALARIGGGNQW